jgi:hypothetical protein
VKWWDRIFSREIVGVYRKEFLAATDRTRRFGLATPRLLLTNDLLLNDDSLTRINEAMFEEIGEIPLDEIVAQCLLMHVRALPIVQSVLEVPVHFTIGYVSSNRSRFFEQTEASLKGMLDSPPTRPEVSLHAWLTLPSDEIIDLTFATSLAVINKMDRGRGAVIASHADKLIGMKYHPMLIGTEYLQRIGAMRFVLTY